jgi:hypothetical protein
MSYETNSAGEAAGSNQFGYRGRFNHDGDYLGWARTPGFNPFKLMAVIAGFAIFPPLGAAALVYFIWNSRRHSWSGHEAHARGEGRSCGRGRMSRSGNAAFDEHRASVLNELEAERRAFAEHRAEQRRKHDQEAYDAFQAKRSSEGEKPADEKK